MVNTRPASCPYEATPAPRAHELNSDTLTQLPGEPGPDDIRANMLDWYINSGFRGCLFNKIAARDTLRDEFTWLTPVEYASIDEIVDGDAGRRILDNFDTIINNSDLPGLVSYILPNLHEAEDYARFIGFLASQDPDRYKILPVVDRASLGLEGEECDYVGIQFRINLGETTDGSDVMAYPMIYTPDHFTTYARRYDHFMIVFNRHIDKNNPETPETYIGVDDIDLGLKKQLFDTLFARSIEVNRDAHSINGSAQEGQQFSRNLFRAHNALVLPAGVWDEYGMQTS